MRETCITRIEDDKKVCIYTSERKYINTIYRLQESHPEEVNITKVNSDGSINAEVPYNWLVFPRPKSTRTLSEEQKQAAGERMKKAREAKNEV